MYKHNVMCSNGMGMGMGMGMEWEWNANGMRMEWNRTMNETYVCMSVCMQ